MMGASKRSSRYLLARLLDLKKKLLTLNHGPESHSEIEDMMKSMTISMLARKAQVNIDTLK